MRQIKLATRQLLGARYNVVNRIVSYRINFLLLLEFAGLTGQ